MSENKGDCQPAPVVVEPRCKMVSWSVPSILLPPLRIKKGILICGETGNKGIGGDEHPCLGSRCVLLWVAGVKVLHVLCAAPMGVTAMYGILAASGRGQRPWQGRVSELLRIEAAAKVLSHIEGSHSHCHCHWIFILAMHLSRWNLRLLRAATAVLCILCIPCVGIYFP